LLKHWIVLTSPVLSGLAALTPTWVVSPSAPNGAKIHGDSDSHQRAVARWL
jgi:hypothetical protein